MTALRQRMIEDMQLRGLSLRTQDMYARAVNQLAQHYNKSPDQITEEELRQYLLYLQNERAVAPSTLTVALCGIKFFYEHTLRREWCCWISCGRSKTRNCRWCSVWRKCARCWTACAGRTIGPV